MNELTQAIAWTMLSILGDEVGEQRMNEAVAEAVGVVVAAEHGDEDALKRIQLAAGAFAATIKARRELTERMEAERRGRLN